MCWIVFRHSLQSHVFVMTLYSIPGKKLWRRTKRLFILNIKATNFFHFPKILEPWAKITIYRQTCYASQLHIALLTNATSLSSLIPSDFPTLHQCSSVFLYIILLLYYLSSLFVSVNMLEASYVSNNEMIKTNPPSFD